MVAKIAMAVAGAALTGVSAIMSSNAKAANQRYMASQMRREEEIVKANAAIDESERRRQLGRVMSHADAQHATRGLMSDNSTSFANIQAETKEHGEFDINNSKLNYMRKAEIYRLRARNMERSAKFTQQQGYFSAITSMAQMGMSAYKQTGFGLSGFKAANSGGGGMMGQG